jgi:hypothetical protein
MSELSDFVITEGRAYHDGDVVLLRSKVNLSTAATEAAVTRLAELSLKTGVQFVFLSPEIEVVEPVDA